MTLEIWNHQHENMTHSSEIAIDTQNSDVWEGKQFPNHCQISGRDWFGKLVRVYIPTNHAKYCAYKKLQHSCLIVTTLHMLRLPRTMQPLPLPRKVTLPHHHNFTNPTSLNVAPARILTLQQNQMLHSPPNVKVPHHQMLPGKIETLTSSHAAPATKSDTPASPNMAPATKVTLHHLQNVTLQHHQICWHPPFARATKKVNLEVPRSHKKTSIDLSRKITFHILKELYWNAQPSFKWQIRPSDPFLCLLLG